MVTGRLEIDEDRVRVIADVVGPLSELHERQVGAVQVQLDAGALDEELVDRLRRTLEAHRGDADLFLEVGRPGAYRLVARAETALRVSPSKQLSQELESMLGPNRVRFRAKPTGA